MAPLAGITVVEIGAEVGVRYCGRLFAALGAEVLRPAGERDDRRLGHAETAGEAYGLWLDEHKIEPVARGRFDDFLKQKTASGKLPSDSEKEALFKQFQAWEAEQNARAQVRAPQKPR